MGTHVVAEFYGLKKEKISIVEQVKPLMLEAVKLADLNKLSETFHQFSPFGVTGVVLLSESHLSIHTWPEYNFAAIDVFTCGKEGNADHALKVLIELFQPTHIKKKKLRRSLYGEQRIAASLNAVRQKKNFF
ncbi:MAG TPA: adenosylmethionine decarboxylase [archaeon]|nr:adenosylmethionine decarboxylase [archaeon]